ncbi:hypothetical protein [Brevibacillus reuszeri]|uniref:hypothetical protein n=1 Tax=Brevibacillus reuszeri TaxID=54915 RepID=UPI003D20B93E
MTWVIALYALEGLFILLCILLGYFIYDKRFNRNHATKVPDGYHATDEINIDPVTNEKTRVYYNPETGDRFYQKI